MWTEVFAFAAGLGAGLMATLIEPIDRWVGRIGRRASRDRGLSMHVESDPAVIWAGVPEWVGFQYFFPDRVPAEEPPASCMRP